MDKPVSVEPFPGVHTCVESQVGETYRGQRDSNFLDWCNDPWYSFKHLNIHWLTGFLGDRVWSIPSAKSATMKLLFFMHLVCFIHLFFFLPNRSISCHTNSQFCWICTGNKSTWFTELLPPPSIHLPILLVIKCSINIIILIDHALGHQSTSCWPVLVYIKSSIFNNLQKSICRRGEKEYWH